MRAGTDVAALHYANATPHLHSNSIPPSHANDHPYANFYSNTNTPAYPNLNPYNNIYTYARHPSLAVVSERRLE